MIDAKDRARGYLLTHGVDKTDKDIACLLGMTADIVSEVRREMGLECLRDAKLTKLVNDPDLFKMKATELADRHDCSDTTIRLWRERWMNIALRDWAKGYGELMK